jgi:hypothetical protein
MNRFRSLSTSSRSTVKVLACLLSPAGAHTSTPLSPRVRTIRAGGYVVQDRRRLVAHGDGMFGVAIGVEASNSVAVIVGECRHASTSRCGPLRVLSASS